MIGSRSMNRHMLTTVVSKIFQGCPIFLFKMSQGCPKDPQSCLQVISQLCQGCPNDSQSCFQVISQLCQGYPKDSQSCPQVIAQLSQGCPKVSSKVFLSKVLVNHPKGSVLIKRFIYNIERNHAVAF